MKTNTTQPPFARALPSEAGGTPFEGGTKGTASWLREAGRDDFERLAPRLRDANRAGSALSHLTDLAKLAKLADGPAAEVLAPDRSGGGLDLRETAGLLEQLTGPRTTGRDLSDPFARGEPSRPTADGGSPFGTVGVQGAGGGALDRRLAEGGTEIQDPVNRGMTSDGPLQKAVAFVRETIENGFDGQRDGTATQVARAVTAPVWVGPLIFTAFQAQQAADIADDPRNLHPLLGGGGTDQPEIGPDGSPNPDDGRPTDPLRDFRLGVLGGRVNPAGQPDEHHGSQHAGPAPFEVVRPKPTVEEMTRQAGLGDQGELHLGRLTGLDAVTDPPPID